MYYGFDAKLKSLSGEPTEMLVSKTGVERFSKLVNVEACPEASLLFTFWRIDSSTAMTGSTSSTTTHNSEGLFLSGYNNVSC